MDDPRPGFLTWLLCDLHHCSRCLHFHTSLAHSNISERGGNLHLTIQQPGIMVIMVVQQLKQQCLEQ
jgi:hypothetical protein